MQNNPTPSSSLALLAGAMGFSGSTSATQFDGEGRATPSSFAASEELISLARVCRDHPGTSVEFIPKSSAWGFDPPELDLLAAMARAAGFANVHHFHEASVYETALEGILREDGPTFVSVSVTPESEGPISRGVSEHARYLQTSLYDGSRRFRAAMVHKGVV